MKAKLSEMSCTHVAVVESDPIRFAGLTVVLGSERDLKLTAVSLSEIDGAQEIDVVLVGGRSGQSVFQRVEAVRAIRPDLRIIVTGSGISDDMFLNSLGCGAKGYVDESAPVQDLVKAIRVVAQGFVWAPRRVLSIFIDRSSDRSSRTVPIGPQHITIREKEVLDLLVEGRSNKEIGRSLDIKERTVKAHVSKLMRKAGVQNRITLSMHALTHSLFSAGVKFPALAALAS
jgi:DNA-binding NarL/FixJ family response regulator